MMRFEYKKQWTFTRCADLLESRRNWKEDILRSWLVMVFLITKHVAVTCKSGFFSNKPCTRAKPVMLLQEFQFSFWASNKIPQRRSWGSILFLEPVSIQQPFVNHYPLLNFSRYALGRLFGQYLSCHTSPALHLCSLATNTHRPGTNGFAARDWTAVLSVLPFADSTNNWVGKHPGSGIKQYPKSPAASSPYLPTEVRSLRGIDPCCM